MSSVSKEIRDWIETHLRGKDAERADDARRTHALVSTLLRELLMNASLSSVPLVLAAGCRLLGSFSSLIGGRAAVGGIGASGRGRAISPVLGQGTVGGEGDTGRGGEGEVNNGNGTSLLVLAMGYLSAGLQQPAARDRAAISVRTLAASCERAIVANPRALEALLQVRGGALCAMLWYVMV